jgi:hypothetical protein
VTIANLAMMVEVLVERGALQVLAAYAVPRALLTLGILQRLFFRGSGNGGLAVLFSRVTGIATYPLRHAGGHPLCRAGAACEDQESDGDYGAHGVSLLGQSMNTSSGSTQERGLLEGIIGASWRHESANPSQDL